MIILNAIKIAVQCCPVRALTYHELVSCLQGVARSKNVWCVGWTDGERRTRAYNGGLDADCGAPVVVQGQSP